VTEIASPRRRVRRWLTGASAPPSLQAQLVLMISALLLGGVLTSLLFVGIWRHTAADGQRAHAAQLADKQQLVAAQRKLASVEAERASEGAALAKARAGQAAAAAELTRLRRLHRAVGDSLRPELQALTATTGTLAHDTSTLKSELAALRAYLKSALPAGADSGFLEAQIKYLVASTESANAAVSRLEQQTQEAQTAAAKLRQPAH
jgi:chromosome segregation ATPase